MKYDDMHWSQRLNSCLKDLGWSQERLATEADIPVKSIQKYCDGQVAQPRGARMLKIATAVHVDILWLRDGMGPKSQLMPVTYFVGAGEEVHAWGEDFDYVRCPGGDPAHHIVAMVRGDSMDPYVQHFDMVMAIRDPAYAPEEIAAHNIPAILETTEGHAWLKRIRCRPGQTGRYDLLSFNPAFEPIEDVEIRWCAPVIRRWSPVFGEDV